MHIDAQGVEENYPKDKLNVSGANFNNFFTE